MGVRRRVHAYIAAPLVRRVLFHARRVTGHLSGRTILRLFAGLLVVILVAAVLVTLFEKPKGDVAEVARSLWTSIYWAVTTVLGAGDASYVQSPPSFVVSWMLVLFGVAIVSTVTGLLVGFFIDILIKEGQGMGASGYKGHIVVCGWNPTARELVEELTSDDYERKIVLVDDVTKNPAGSGTYFIQGDSSRADDLTRAGIQEAAAAIVFPRDGSNESDMRSLVTVLAIESLAPAVRTVVEVNNPSHVDHFRRAKADEILVTSRLTSRLLARSALYPGLTEIVTDIVSGGEGSELYRIALPPPYVGQGVNDVSAQLRIEHSATLLAIARDGRTYVNPPADFRVSAGDDAVVVAESLGTLAPLQVESV